MIEAPPGGWHADDLDRLPPEFPRHVELIDGELVVPGPQSAFHLRATNALCLLLASQVPDGLAVATRMTIKIGDRRRPDPDVLVLDERSLEDDDRTWYAPDEVHLVIEVVSPESKARDTQRKPRLYAEAGIRHFWWVENDGGRPVVYTYELDPATRKYVATGIYRDSMTVSAQFPIRLQVDSLDQWRPVRLA